MAPMDFQGRLGRHSNRAPIVGTSNILVRPWKKIGRFCSSVTLFYCSYSPWTIGPRSYNDLDWPRDSTLFQSHINGAELDYQRPKPSHAATQGDQRPSKLISVLSWDDKIRVNKNTKWRRFLFMHDVTRTRGITGFTQILGVVVHLVWCSHWILLHWPPQLASYIWSYLVLL